MENNTNSFNDKKKKKLTFLVIAMLVCILACIIVAGTMFGITLARYQTLGDSTGKDMPIAKWGVTTDISDNLHIQNNDYVVDGKIAPATEGYVDVKIKLDGTEVAVDYEITINDVALATGVTGVDVPAITVSKVALQNADSTETELTKTAGTGNTKYTGLIELVDGNAFAANTEFVVRIYFAWENDEANNENDTKLGNLAEVANRKVTFTLKVGAKQHIPANESAGG